MSDTKNEILEKLQNNDVKVKPELYKGLGDHTRFVDQSFGNVKTQTLEISGDFIVNSIAMGTPVDGGVVTIPTGVSVVILTNTVPYTQLSLNMPMKPKQGQTLTIVCTVDVPNLSLLGADFGTKKPTKLTADIPRKYIFATDKWYNFT